MVIGKIGHAQHLPRLSVQLVLLTIRKKQHPFPSNKLSMKDMAQVDVEMNMCDGPLSPYKKHRVFLNETFHIRIRPGKIFYDLRRMLKNIKEENSQIQRALLYFFQVISKFHIGISSI